MLGFDSLSSLVFAGRLVPCPPSVRETPGKAPASTRGLLEAVVGGQLETVRDLLARDEGLLHARDGEGRSAYALAYLHHHPDIGTLLLEKGYRPDLHEAALAREWDLLEELLVASPGSGRCFNKGWQHYVSTIGATIFAHNLVAIVQLQV